MTTKTGTTPEQGDIVLIPVPFTDLTSRKKQPVIVVSNGAYNASSSDIVVVAMTSNPRPVPYSFRITSSDLEHGKLNRPGTVRPDKVYTLSQSIVVKTFGRVKTEILVRVRQCLNALTAPGKMGRDG